MGNVCCQLLAVPCLWPVNRCLPLWLFLVVCWYLVEAHTGFSQAGSHRHSHKFEVLAKEVTCAHDASGLQLYVVQHPA